MIGWIPKPFIFVHVPKCAGTSIEKAFIPIISGREGFHDLPDKERSKFWLPGSLGLQHSKLNDYGKHFKLKEYFKFAFVRNPWDRAVSQIQYLQRMARWPALSRGTFKECLQVYCTTKQTIWGHDLGACQVDYLMDSFGKLSMDFVGRFESLLVDFAKLCEMIGIKTIPDLPHALGSKRTQHYSDFYDAETTDWIRTRFARDIDFFGYQFEKKPAKTVRGGLNLSYVKKKRKLTPIPHLLHCPQGAPKQLFEPVVSYFLSNCEMPKSPTVDVITYNNTSKLFPLEVQAKRLGLRLHVVAQDFHPWTWVAKITEPKTLLENLRYPPNQLVMLADGNDTIFTRPPYASEIKKILRHYGSPAVLFCPTSKNHPEDEECRVFERKLSASPTPHMSAGAYVGTVKGILEGLNWIESRRQKEPFNFFGQFDDQLAWRRAHRAFYPQIAIDTEGLIFNRFDQMFLSAIAKENVKRSRPIKIPEVPKKQRPSSKKKKKRYVFIDCGANQCKALREFLIKYPNFEFFAFEPQPDLVGEGRKVINEHPHVKIKFYQKAVWIKDQKLPFYLATRWSQNYKGGSTLLKGHNNNNSAVDYLKPTQVEAIDFSRWIAKNFNANDHVIVKMDIEGAEYEVLEKIIKDNNHPIIKMVIAEFHQPMNPTITRQRHDALVAKVKSFAKLVKWR